MYKDIELFQDFYQVSMAYGYWKSGIAEKKSVFHHYFRKNPFNGGYGIACGLEYFLEFIDKFEFSDDSLNYLIDLKGNDGEALFEEEFINFLGDLKLDVEVHAMREGELVFAHEPMVRITGPLLQCQLLETPVLNMLNFQTLIATKAARVCHAAKGDTVLEFGARRAQGIDGALTASRAAYIGGCHATSNVLASKVHGIPVKGTHAHAWVTAFSDEVEAFTQYAEAMPNNCTFLVDTYDSIQGIKNAISVWENYRSDHKLQGIRLDSGDLATLSIEARKLLDEAGHKDANIVASNDLDEVTIESLKQQGAQINIWGVGTNLVTGGEQSALGGVYKLAGIEDENGWRDTIKLSEQTIKVSNPGIQQVRRFEIANRYIGDMIYNEGTDLTNSFTAVDVSNNVSTKKISSKVQGRDLLELVFTNGQRVNKPRRPAEIREYAKINLRMLEDAAKRFLNPHSYFVGLEQTMFDRKVALINKHKKEVTNEE